MTAPFAPPPPRAVWIVLGLMVCVAAVLPFARRNDWIGWSAFVVIAAANAALCGMLLWGIVRAVRERLRNDPPD
jgi:hypothetical protein